jgi:hypothetical protein
MAAPARSTDEPEGFIGAVSAMVHIGPVCLCVDDVCKVPPQRSLRSKELWIEVAALEIDLPTTSLRQRL